MGNPQYTVARERDFVSVNATTEVDLMRHLDYVEGPQLEREARAAPVG